MFVKCKGNLVYSVTFANGVLTGRQLYAVKPGRKPADENDLFPLNKKTTKRKTMLTTTRKVTASGNIENTKTMLM